MRAPGPSFFIPSTCRIPVTLPVSPAAAWVHRTESLPSQKIALDRYLFTETPCMVYNMLINGTLKESLGVSWIDRKEG